MSLWLVYNLSNEIETIVNADGNPWFKRAHVGYFLDLKNIRIPSEGLDKCEMRIRKDLIPTTWPGPKGLQNKTEVCLSKRGFLYVINKCRKPIPNLINLTKCLGTEFHKSKWLCQKQDTLSQIMQAFNGEEMIHQFGVRKYRIDLYFSKYKLAFECDEFDHRNRDIGCEVEWEKDIEKLLNYTFVRFNPDAKNFCVLVVNKIFVQIKSFFLKKKIIE